MNGRPIARSLLLEDYGRIARRRSRLALDATALRTRSLAARDVLAHLTTSGRGNHDWWLQRLREMRHAPDRWAGRSLPWLDPDWAARLARVQALQDIELDDRENALATYRHLFRRHGPAAVSGVHAPLFADLLLRGGHDEELAGLVDDLELSAANRRRYELDLVNPFRRDGGPRDVDRWRRLLRDFMADGRGPLLTLEDVDSSAVPFDALSAQVEQQVDGPLITVIMSSYHPDAGLTTAVKSMLAQSWRNFELLIIDDASPPEYHPLLEEVAGLDERIRLVRKPVNGGTYRARNTAMLLARGEFITCQDSDDWSHPRRLELQVKPLLADPALVGTRSRCLRVLEDLTLTYPGYEPIRPNASSLMFRRHVVMEKMGFFDEVRKGADSEYFRRMRVVFGDVVEDIPEPVMAIVRLNADSLSRGEFRPGWHHKARFVYRTAYEEWHREIKRGADPYLAHRLESRPFPAPRRFLDARSGDPDAHYDVVLVGDWRSDGGPQRSMIEEIHAMRAAGLRVAIAHMEALRFMRHNDPPLCAPVRRLIQQRVVDVLVLDDRISADLVIVRYPPVLQFPPAEPSSWDVASLWIVANQAPSERDGRDLRYLVEDCTREALRIFHVVPVWVPQGPSVRDSLEATLAPVTLTSFDTPGLIDVSAWHASHRPWEHDVPRVGRYSRDTPMKFPASGRELLVAYDAPDVSVVMMGATVTVPELLDAHEVPSNWTLVEQNEVPVKDFLRQIDFFVYFDHPESYEAFGRSVLEALASGCLVVLPHHFAKVFGDAAVYASPAEAMDVVRAYHRDRTLFEQQAERAAAHVEQHFSRASFVRRLLGYVPALAEAATPTDPVQGSPVEVASERPAASWGEHTDHRYGFLMTCGPSPVVVPHAWSTHELGDITYRCHPDTSFARARIEDGDSLRSPYDVVLVGDVVDLETGRAGAGYAAEVLARAFVDDGVDGVTRRADRLGGRFLVLVHDHEHVWAIPDACGSQLAHWANGGGTAVLASHATLVEAALGAARSEAIDRHRPGAWGEVVPVVANCRLVMNTLSGEAHLERIRPAVAMTPLTPTDQKRARQAIRTWIAGLTEQRSVVQLAGESQDRLLAHVPDAHADRVHAWTSTAATSQSQLAAASVAAFERGIRHLVVASPDELPDEMVASVTRTFGEVQDLDVIAELVLAGQGADVHLVAAFGAQGRVRGGPPELAEADLDGHLGWSGDDRNEYLRLTDLREDDLPDGWDLAHVLVWEARMLAVAMTLQQLDMAVRTVAPFAPADHLALPTERSVQEPAATRSS